VGGIITRAFSPTRAILSRLIGVQVPTSAVPAQLILQLMELEPPEAALQQIQQLNYFYRNTVIQQSGRSRLLAAFTFLSTFGDVRSELASLDVPANEIGAILGQSSLSVIANNPNPPRTDLAEAVELLAAAADVEAHGLHLAQLKGINPTALLNSIKKSGRSALQKEALVEIIIKGVSPTYQGFYLAAFGSLLFPLALLILLFALWCWSGGYVFCRAKGGLLRRTIAMTLVAFPLWPLSFIFFLLLRWKKNKRDAQSR
jgi:hypothetical protein